MDGATGLGGTSAAARAGFPATGPREAEAARSARSARILASAPEAQSTSVSPASNVALADGASLTSRQFGLAIGPFSLRYVSDRLDIGAATDRSANETASSVASASAANLTSEPSADTAAAATQQAPAGSVVRDADFSRLLRDMARNRRSGRQTNAARSGDAAAFRSASSASDVRSSVVGDSGGSSQATRRRGVAAYQAQLAAPSFVRSGAAFSLTV